MRSLIRVPQLVSLSVCVCVATSLLSPLAVAQTVIPLYSGDAPGGTQAPNQEKQYFSTAWNTAVVTNVSRPTLTVYKPTGGVPSGSAVVICPGGGFMALSIDNEGNQVAKYLAARGITAFVLRYRLGPPRATPPRTFSDYCRTTTPIRSDCGEGWAARGRRWNGGGGVCPPARSRVRCVG